MLQQGIDAGGITRGKGALCVPERRQVDMPHHLRTAWFGDPFQMARPDGRPDRERTIALVVYQAEDGILKGRIGGRG